MNAATLQLITMIAPMIVKFGLDATIIFLQQMQAVTTIDEAITALRGVKTTEEWKAAGAPPA